MSDDMDRMQDAEEIILAAALSNIAADIPAGVSGECDECGEFMKRLVGGRCGFCRDGRRPPLSRYSDAAPVASAEPCLDMPMAVQAATAPALGVPLPAEEDAMPNAVIDTRKVSIKGVALEAVDRRAAALDISFQQAANDLIEAAVNGVGGPVEQVAEVVAADLAHVSAADLIDELSHRLQHDAPGLLAAAIARAESAEASLATIKQVLADVRPQA